MRILVVALVLACACGTGRSSTALVPPSPPTGALAAWKDFPANANPRPLIVFGVSRDHIGPAGFSSEPDRKIAWFCNKFVFAGSVALSDTAPARATAGNSGSYPSIGSARAFAEMMATRPQVSAQPQCATSQPFAIKAVRWGTAGFPTDRGDMTMSAWLFDIAEIDAYLSYSAVDPSSFWGGKVISDSGGRGGRISGDGLTLKIPVSNADPGPCGADYTASAAESKSAVAVAVKRYPHAAPDQPVVCDLVLRISYISVTLKSPLGGRVLVDESGDVGAVCPDHGDC